jgi:phosphohistidine phosphatase
MKLFFLRHGIAEDTRPGGMDRDRRLTPEGIEEMQGVARGMRELDLRLDRVLTSPYVRARESAEIVVGALGLEERLQQSPLLACGFGPRELLELIETAEGKVERTLLVGHEPDLSGAIVHLIGGGSVRMQKASLARVDCSTARAGTGELRWLLTAEQLCRIGRD